MDKQPNFGSMTPGSNPPSGPINPETGQPDHTAEVSALKTWLWQNALSLVISAIVISLVCIYLDPIDSAKVVIGLGFIIFIHELGHFLAAKWCDVHVKTFSIGFGPAVPFCSYKWGETTYMLGIVPLGGYVSMVGEGTGESTPEGDPDDDDNDPRSFKNKAVSQRMLIISAGVVMNVILGTGCFIAAYLHGVLEKPATVGSVESGSAAWRAGIRTDADIKKIGSRENPFFNDIRSIVLPTLKGEQVPVVVDQLGPNGLREVKDLTAEPLKDEGALFPQLGVAAPYRLTLVETKKRSIPPVVPGSVASLVKPTSFEPGDRIVGMTDPLDPTKVTSLPEDPHEPGSGKPSFTEYYRRMVLLAEKPITFAVLHKGEPVDARPIDIIVEPAYRSDLGLRMSMGKVVAVRRGGPADGKVEPVPLEGGTPGAGDKLKAVKLPPGSNGRRTWFVSGSVELDWTKPEFQTEDRSKVDVKPLDPILLPLELDRWTDGKPASWDVEIVVLRQQGHKEDDPVQLKLQFDPSFRFAREMVNNPNSPLPIPGLGLAYWVEAVVSNQPEAGSVAAEAGVKPNDQVIAVRFKRLDASGNLKTDEWEEIKPHQWARVETAFQFWPPHEIDLKLKQGDDVREVTLKGKPDTNWGLSFRGLEFDADFREQKAADFGDAIRLGGYRTIRFVRDVYLNLYAMIRGRVSPRTMSGPLTIATVSYRFAGEDFWQFLQFLGLISVNLAVVNFLPIPILDGGHMVFLICEKVLGKPLPERLFSALMWVGLGLILLLFLSVTVLDIRRIFFGLI